MTRTQASTVFVASAHLVVFALAVAVVTSPLIAGAIAICGFLAVIAFGSPRAAFWIWLVVAVSIPDWFAIPAGLVIPPLTAVAIPLILGLACRVRSVQFKKIDFLLLGLLLLSGFMLLAGSDPGIVKDVVLVWGSAYVAGRLFAIRLEKSFIEMAYLRVAVLVAIWAIAEFLFSWHVFEGVMGPVAEINFWNEIQLRGSLERSEGAFGHSICLAAYLVTALPFLLKRNRSIVLWMLMAVAIVSTLSRAGVIGLGFALLLSIWVFKWDKRLALLFLLTAGAAIAVAPELLFGFNDVSSQQIGGSTNYRLYLLTTGFDAIQWFGTSNAYFVSVDNAFLRIGLDLGWAVLILFSLLTLIPFLRVIFRRTTETIEVALATNFPILLTVALLTQWQSILWMLGGLAVSIAANNSEAAQPSTGGLDSTETSQSQRLNQRLSSAS